MNIDTRVRDALAEIDESARLGLSTSQRLATLHESRRRRTRAARASVALSAVAVLVVGAAVVARAGSTGSVPSPIGPAPTSTPTPSPSGGVHPNPPVPAEAVRSIHPLAGSTGLYGSADGVGAAARFGDDQGLAVGPTGTVYLVDNNSADHQSRIRAVTPDGGVTTLASEKMATVEGGFRHITVDSSGDVYAVSGHSIRKLGPGGQMSILAGIDAAASGSQPASVDGIGHEARFDSILGMAVSPSGDLYITGSGVVRRVTPTGKVETLTACVTAPSLISTSDCLGWPGAIAVGPTGTIFIGSDDYRLRTITPDGTVTELAVGNLGWFGLFHRIASLVVDPTDSSLVVHDGDGWHRVALDGTVSEIHGVPVDSYSMAIGNDGAMYSMDQNALVLLRLGR